jgi:hypothetical protein
LAEQRLAGVERRANAVRVDGRRLDVVAHVGDVHGDLVVELDRRDAARGRGVARHRHQRLDDDGQALGVVALHAPHAAELEALGNLVGAVALARRCTHEHEITRQEIDRVGVARAIARSIAARASRRAFWRLDHGGCRRIGSVRGANWHTKGRLERSAGHGVNFGGEDFLHLIAELLDAGADIDGSHALHDTACHVAVLRGHADVVELLIARGADLARRDKRGNAPLCTAVANNDTRVAVALINAGAPLDGTA